MQIQVSQSVLESQRVKNQSFSCKISTNYKQPRQSVVESQQIKSYWKSRADSNSSCIFLERDPCLWWATKICCNRRWASYTDGYTMELKDSVHQHC